MSIINQSVHFNNSKVLNSRIQSKCCVKSFVSMLSPIKETLKNQKVIKSTANSPSRTVK